VLAIVFNLGEERFALEATQLLSVVPAAPLRALPGAMPGVVGMLPFRRRHIPVVDLELLVNGVLCRERLSTRILVVDVSSATQSRWLGLRVEGALDSLTLNADAAQAPDRAQIPGADYLGHLVQAQEQTVQVVRVEGLLTPELVSLFEMSPAAASTDIAAAVVELPMLDDNPERVD